MLVSERVGGEGYIFDVILLELPQRCAAVDRVNVLLHEEEGGRESMSVYRILF